MNDLVTTGGIEGKLAIASQYLAECKTDFERLEVRDQAKAISAAAQIMQRRDIQVHASLLVQRAERAIAKANPAQKGWRVSKSDTLFPRGNNVSPLNLHKFRDAHDGLSDDDFEALVSQSEQSMEPLTRKAVKVAKQKAVQAAEKAELEKNPPPLPESNGRYPLLYADPPWQYEHSKTNNRKIENHYPTMTLDAIKALPVADLAEDDCVLLLWATAPKLAEAISVIDAWGFLYRTSAVWVKPSVGMGYWFRNRHELLLLATKGKPKPPQECVRVGSVFEAKRTAHSAKPDCVRTAIETMYPYRQRLELFARQAHDGWDAWGNEV